VNPDLKKLYQETLLAHSKRPLNRHPQEGAAKASARNDLCGDDITVYRASDGTFSFTAQACSVCIASASMMTEHLAQLTTQEAAAASERLISKLQDAEDPYQLPDELASLTGVHAFPSRIRCATLPWEAARDLLSGELQGGGHSL